jgi:ribonuclease-3
MPPSDCLQVIGYTFKNQALLEEAFRHPSCCGLVAKKPGYERLEFLGDSVLSLVISKFLFEFFPQDAEGELTRRRASLTSAKALFKVGARLNIFKHVSIAKDKATIEERETAKVIGNVLESLIGALYLDGGMLVCEDFILKTWGDMLKQDIVIDSKSALQHWSQKHKVGCPKYHLVSTQGRAHLPIFKVKVTVSNLPEFTASGGSKKLAEEAAATLAMNFINERHD